MLGAKNNSHLDLVYRHPLVTFWVHEHLLSTQLMPLVCRF